MSKAKKIDDCLCGKPDCSVCINNVKLYKQLISECESEQSNIYGKIKEAELSLGVIFRSYDEAMSAKNAAELEIDKIHRERVELASGSCTAESGDRMNMYQICDARSKLVTRESLSRQTIESANKKLDIIENERAQVMLNINAMKLDIDNIAADMDKKIIRLVELEKQTLKT